MSEVLLHLLNTAINASYLIAAVILVRWLMRRAPRWISCLMWGVVGLRLVMPFSIQSIFSIIPSAAPISDVVYIPEMPSSDLSILSASPNQTTSILPYISEEYVYETVFVNRTQTIINISAWIWIAGLAALLIYGVISYIRLYRRVRPSLCLSDNIYYCDGIDTPFIFGMIKPRIYLPSGIKEEHIPYVVEHERAHLRRGDHIIKPIGFILLAVYWFDPLVWVAYVLMCRDLEEACDRRVIRGGDGDTRRRYSEALLECSARRRTVFVCPLAFGEVAVKDRIKSVLSYKKPALWIIITAIVCCGVLVVTLFTVPRPDDGIDARLAVFLDCQIAARHEPEEDNGYFRCINYELLDTYVQGDRHTFYLWTVCCEYSYDGVIRQQNEQHEFAVIKADKTNQNYELVEYWTPESKDYSGDEYKREIHKKVPVHLWDTALDPLSGYRLLPECDSMAFDHFDIETDSVVWEYNGLLGRTDFHHIEFLLNFDYTHIEMECDKGWFQEDFNAETMLKDDYEPIRGTTYTGKNMVWKPLVLDEESAVSYSMVEQAEIDFTVYNGKKKLHSGTVVIKMISGDGVLSYTYDVSLKNCRGLKMTLLDNRPVIVAR